MASNQHVEVEAAKFLHKLIVDSKDEPSKLATKLYVICQHMKMSGKEQSLPYQVISRAMETVISDNKLDIEALKSSRLSLGNLPQIGDSSQGAGVHQKQTGRGTWHSGQTSESKEQPFGRTSQNSTLSKECKETVGVSEPGKAEFLRHDVVNRGSFSQSLEHESSASVPMEDNSTASYTPAGRKEAKKKGSVKRKRADSKESSEIQGDDPQQSDSASTRFNSWKGKQAGRVVAQSHLSAKDGEHSYDESVQQGAQMGQGNETRRQIKCIDERETNPLPLQKTEKTSASQPLTSNMPFKEHHLKQLRAQCLVFLAFRNNVPPRKLHLEIALGERYPKEDGNHRGLIDVKGKPSASHEHGQYLESPGSLVETDSSSKDTDKNNQNKAVVEKCQSSSKLKTEISQLKCESESLASTSRWFSETKSSEDSCNRVNQVGTWANQNFPSSLRKNIVLNPEVTAPSMNNSVSYSMAMIQHEVASEGGINLQEQTKPSCIGERTNRPTEPEFPIVEANMAGDRSESISATKSQTSQSENLKSGMNSLRELHSDKLPTAPELAVQENRLGVNGNGVNGLNDPRTSGIHKQSISNGLKTIIYCDASRGGTLGQVVEKLMDHDDESSSMESLDTPLSPKFSTSEKWILVHQKKRRVEEEKWASKQRKAEERITMCFEKLKESVNASEDISTKTKSVIELKKLQLLQVQRRLRSDFLGDFFKPISSEMEHLKSIKKHRHGRKIKQLERFEQKMKEERQKRVRERQKEFFGEIEVHKERLEDYLKIKRERCKGINRYIKEFHKRKERIHREKIDRIQREKINLLKANDVEGYLRMVQDAKSDRVKQLLKETEKYLQKLGAKIKEAKSASRLFGGEVDGSDAALAEKNEILKDPVDEDDQAQHYLESNEKYYLMAHSVKETIEEQPITLLGGKLREYQMNGLRWLVSLYNNHLNGILADEMGLGKTVQVISLICYLMETKNDRGPFLVVVPSSVLPGWDSEINFWAPGINKIMYAGTPEERRRLFKERIVHKKFNVLLTTYEYLMNKHDRPKLSKIDWHYVIIDEGHRIKNASCKLNADLKHYRSNHRLLLTGTPLQNNLEELWALLNFLLPNIFNSSEDFSQWFNKPFQSNNDGSADEALLSEEENLLIINRLHQVLRPFVLRRLKHKVENELPEKIERLVRCEASAYQKLLMKRVEDNLGSIGNSKGRSVHNTVMELRNICNHPYLSQLHADEVDALLPKHYLPPLVRLCGKMEMVDRLLPKLKATGHRVLFFSTMTRLLDVMEEYLHWKHYRYLRLDGHTSGSDRGALIEEFNRPDSSSFIFLLSIRAGGVGVNLQAADTVLIFDTDWNPQVDLQAQARAHRIGQKRDVLVLRLETVNTVEEQVRAAAEHKLGVANQSITAGFFDNNTSAEDRREYLESLLRECKKEEEAPVLDDDALNDLLARSEAEIDVFESVDRQRRELEAATWQKLIHGRNSEGQDPLPIPPRLVTDKDLEPLYKVFDLSEAPVVTVKRKGDVSLDTQHYGRGKRAREVRSYEDQWTEEEFEKLCQAESPGEALKVGFLLKDSCLPEAENSGEKVSLSNSPQSTIKENSTPVKRGRGRPRRLANDTSMTSELSQPTMNQDDASFAPVSDPEHSQLEREIIKKKLSVISTDTSVSPSKVPPKVLGRKTQTGETSRGRGKKSSVAGRTKVSKSFSYSPIAKMQESFNTQSSEPKEESAIDSTKEISSAMSSPALKNDEEKPLSIDSTDLTCINQQVESENVGNQDTNGLSKMPETEATETRDSTPALVSHVSEKKISVTRKKAAAREARNSGGSKPLPLKRMPAGTSVSQKDSRGNSIITQIDQKQELDSETQENSSKSVTIASSRRGSSDSSLADTAPWNEEKDSKSVEEKGSTKRGECSYQNIIEPPADQLTLEIPPSVQSCDERVIEPSLITVAAGTSDENIHSSDSSTTEERRVASSSYCDSGGSNALTREEAIDLMKDCVPPNLSVSQAGQASLVDHEVSALDNKSTFSISFIDFVKDVECTVDVQVHEDVNMPVEAVNLMETCDLEFKNMMSTEDRRDKVEEAIECPASAMEPAHDLADMSSIRTPTCTAEESSSVPIIAQISSKPADPEPQCLASNDNIQDYDALASEGQSVVAKGAKNEGNDIDLALQDKIQDYDTSVTEDHSADATCTNDKDNGISIALRDKIQDYDAAASDGHSADASCAEDGGIDINVASEDKHQGYDASLLVGHSGDATFMKDGHTHIGLPSQDNIQDYDAFASVGCASDAMCIQDEGNDIGFPSHDKDQDYDVSVSVCHSRDAACMKDEVHDTGFPSLHKNQDYDALASEGGGAVATCVKDEGDDINHALQDKNQDYGASTSKDHTADATCISDDDGDDVDLALLDKNQDYGASVSVGHSADATYIKDEGDDANLASLDKNQEYLASTSEGHIADATCINHDGDDVNLSSLDTNQDYNASASEGHSADATCMKDYGNDINLVSALEVRTEDATCIMDEGNNFSPVHSLPQNQASDPSQWGKNAEDISHVSSVSSPMFEAELIALHHDKGREDDPIIDSSSMLIADTDKSSSEQLIAVVEKSSSGQLVADMHNSSSEQPIADMENSSYKQPITDLGNSTFKTPVAGMDYPSSEPSVAEVDKSSSWQPIAGMENSSSELPVADVDYPSSEPSIADVDKSSSWQPIAGMENSSSELPVADVKSSSSELSFADVGKSSSGQPVADMENSSSKKPISHAENSSSELRIADVENSSSEPPIADVEKSSEPPVADVSKSSSGQHVADLENSSSEPPVANVDKSSSELPAADVDKSSSGQPVADVDNSSSEQPSADADNSSSEQPIANLEKLSSDQPVVDMDRSSSGQPITDVDNSSSEQPVANVDNSSPAEQDICPENAGYIQMPELSNVGRTNEGISNSGKNSAISEASRVEEEDPKPLTECEITGDRVPHSKIDNVSVDQPSL